MFGIALLAAAALFARPQADRAHIACVVQRTVTVRTGVAACGGCPPAFLAWSGRERQQRVRDRGEDPRVRTRRQEELRRGHPGRKVSWEGRNIIFTFPGGSNI